MAMHAAFGMRQSGSIPTSSTKDSYSNLFAIKASFLGNELLSLVRFKHIQQLFSFISEKNCVQLSFRKEKEYVKKFFDFA